MLALAPKHNICMSKIPYHIHHHRILLSKPCLRSSLPFLIVRAHALFVLSSPKPSIRWSLLGFAVQVSKVATRFQRFLQGLETNTAPGSWLRDRRVADIVGVVARPAFATKATQSSGLDPAVDTQDRKLPFTVFSRGFALRQG